MVTQNKRLFIILLAVPLLLLIPLIAMQFTNEVNWSVADFFVMGILLCGAGLISELVFRKVNNLEYRMIFLLIILVSFILIWAELAVGILGTPFAGS